MKINIGKNAERMLRGGRKIERRIVMGIEEEKIPDQNQQDEA